MAEKTGSFYGLELEVYSTLIEKKSIKNEKDLLKFLEELLFDFNDYRETHAVSDSSTFGGDFGDKDFVIKSKEITCSPFNKTVALSAIILMSTSIGLNHSPTK